MAKLQNPFNSFRAQGSIRRALTVRRSARKHIAEKFPTHPDANTAPQQAQRLMFQMCADLWHILSPTEQKLWESTARPFHMTGYAYYLSQCLKPNPGIYLPLAGGTMQGVIGMDSNRITDLPAPVGNADPSRLQDLTTHAALASGVHGLKGEVSFFIYQSSSQSIPTDTVTLIDWDTKLWDIGTYFSLTNDRFQPTVEGKYRFALNVGIVSLADGNTSLLRIHKNGVLAAELYRSIQGANASVTMAGPCDIYLNGTTDYIDAHVYHDYGSSRPTGVGGYRTWFSGFLIPQS